MVLGLLLLIQLAPAARNAAPEGVDLPDAGRVRLQLSPGAEVQQVPRVQPGRIELVIRGNRQDLEAQLEGVRVRFLEEADAWSVGGGTWLMEFQVARADVVLTVEREEATDAALLSFKPGVPETVPPPAAAPPLAALLRGDLARNPAQHPALALHPLDGDAALAMDPTSYTLSAPIWQPELPNSWEATLLKNHAYETGYTVDRYRHVLTDTLNPELEAYAFYRLGRAHLALELPREAAYYMNRVAGTDVEWPGPEVQLARAQAMLANGRWDEARERCADAAAAGAREAEVLECLGVVSLATAAPAPSETARALARATGRPEALLLAGELLQKDHRHREALPLLQEAVDLLPEGAMHTMALINVGDAFLATRQFEQAREAWRDAGLDRDAARVTALRQRTRQLVEEGAETWLANLPDLYRVKDRPDRAGAEALFLLAQIATTFDDLAAGVEHLTALADKHRELGRRPEVGGWLWELLDQRLKQLAGQERHLELASFYRDNYKPWLQPMVRDTASMEAVARAYEAMGLAEAALDVQREVFAVHTRLELDDAAALVDLARLYVLTDRPAEALRTLEYLRGVPGAAEVRSPALLLEGLVHYQAGRLDEACVPLAEANQRKPGTEEIARLRAEAGCD